MSLLSSLLVSFSVFLPFSPLLRLENIPNKSSVAMALSHGLLVLMKIILLINSLKLQKCEVILPEG